MLVMDIKRAAHQELQHQQQQISKITIYHTLRMLLKEIKLCIIYRCALTGIPNCRKYKSLYGCPSQYSHNGRSGCHNYVYCRWWSVGGPPECVHIMRWLIENIDLINTP